VTETVARRFDDDRRDDTFKDEIRSVDEGGCAPGVDGLIDERAVAGGLRPGPGDPRETAVELEDPAEGEGLGARDGGG
jgi:hypothetical protein